MCDRVVERSPFVDLTFGLKIGLQLEHRFLKLRGESLSFNVEQLRSGGKSDATLGLFIK